MKLANRYARHARHGELRDGQIRRRDGLGTAQF